jgi:hypothetical protein
MPSPPESNPWLPEFLHTDSTEYFPAPPENPPKAILMRGAENWLTRFASPGESANGRAVKEEVQALFARWLRMQNLCVLMGAGASLYATNILNAELLDHAAGLLKGRASADTLDVITGFASDKSKPRRRIEEFLSQLQALCGLFEASDAPLDKLPVPEMVTNGAKTLSVSGHPRTAE